MLAPFFLPTNLTVLSIHYTRLSFMNTSSFFTSGIVVKLGE